MSGRPRYTLLFFLLLVALYLTACSMNDWNMIESAGSLINTKEFAEDIVIGKFVQKFRKERPISTSIEDAYKRANNINDFPPRPVSKAVMDELRQNGKVFLRPGIYDFYLQSFCLHAGKYAPTSGAGYLIAPLKGSRASIIKRLLENSSKRSDIRQYAIQDLIWGIEIGLNFSKMGSDVQATAKKVLSEEDLKQLGKSFWDVLPDSIRSRLFSELKEKLPEEIRETLEDYDRLKNRMSKVGSTYKEIEEIAVKFGEPPIPKDMLNVESGAWGNIEGKYYMRVFPEGYSQTRVQVYVPEGTTTSEADANINEDGSRNSISDRVGIIFSPSGYVAVPANTNSQRLGLRDVGYNNGINNETDTERQNPTNKAEDLIGKAYKDYDCSKLIQTIYPHLPRTAKEQYDFLKKQNNLIFDRKDLRESDVIFFKDKFGNIKHIGYVKSNDNGNITMIHSSWSKQEVTEVLWSTSGQEGSNNMLGKNLIFAGGGDIK